ncbi:MAG: CcoQ/FixQ family Cbb3-type cytochrome c oxidase assembly chaperone [Leptothrix sp. (in: Bacteria)]|nr:CcoQ/FixQ family Cbb3-type cytochrome c oxidase assembly chaperone [Leptothrix sp. (in: b-proteobacteria)]
MDVNDLRSAVTVALFLLFLALVAYTWSRKRKAEYDEAAQLPFAGDNDAVESRGEKS